MEVVGVSTVFGNASLQVTDRVTRALADEFHGAGLDEVPIYEGSAVALDRSDATEPKPAHAALRRAWSRVR